MLKRFFSLFIGITLLFPFSTGASLGTHILINEIQIYGETSTDEYVVLYNPLNADVPLAGYRLQKVTLSGGKYSLVTTFPDIVIKSKGFLTVGHTNFKGKKDLVYSTTSSIADDNAIILYNDAGRTAIDKLGFGKNTYGEGTSIPNPGKGEVYKRKIDGFDTNNNSGDFGIVSDKTEEESSDADSPSGSNYSLEGVCLSEIMPNPKSPEMDTSHEWIELYNSSNLKVDLSGAILRDFYGSVREYVVPNGIFVEPKRYAIFYSSATRITLNNNNDKVQFLDKNRNLICETPEYDKTLDGESYSLFQDGWGWTLRATPLAENIFERKEEAEKKEAVTKSKIEKREKAKKEKREKVKKEKKEKAKKSKIKKDKVVKGSAKKAESKKQKDDKLEDVKTLNWNNKNLGYFLIFLGAFLFYNYILYRKDIYEYIKQKFGRDT